MATTLKYSLGSLRLKPAPMPTPAVLASLHPEAAAHLKQVADWSKQAFDSHQQLANAVRELQGLQSK